MTTNYLRMAKRKISAHRKDPVLFVRDVFGVEPDAWQVEFLESYHNHNRVAAKACKGPGKTAVLAWCCWHFLVCYAHPKVVATSITGDNLRDGLWTEMAKWQQKSEFLKSTFDWKAERITSADHAETWYMSARRWAKAADPEEQANALAGLHADNIMFVVDEAGGVPDAVVAAAEAALANAGTEVNPDAIAKLLLCGNPTNLSGPLYRACTKEKSLWHVIEITGDPDDPKRSPRISITWAREQIQKYGREHPWVLVNVFGKFPPASMNGLIGPDDMAASMKRVVPKEAYSHAAKILGVDVARQGDDSTVIFPRQGLVAFKPKQLRIANSEQVAGHVANAFNQWKADMIFVDATGGWGWGVIEALQKWGYPVTPVGFADSAMDRQYKNMRAEINFKGAEWVRCGGCLPDLPELVEEATAVTYFHNRDQLQIVEKDQIKVEIGRSPDFWDAFCLTHAYPVAPRNPLDAFRPVQQSNEYNPLVRHYEHEAKQHVADYDPFRHNA